MSAPRFKYYTPRVEEIDPIAIYSLAMGEGHSDVSGESLLEKGLPIPLTPDHKTWERLVVEKKKCGRCFASVRGHDDLTRHSSIHHGGAKPYLPR